MKIIPRHYWESDRNFFENNREACIKLLEDYTTMKPCMIATLPDGSEKIFIGEADPDNFPHARCGEAELDWIDRRMRDGCKKIKYEWRKP